MPIPPFNSDGLLPPGRYSCSVSDVEQYFVVGYPTSQTRRGLFDGWAQYRTTLGAIVPLTAEWIGGGFVENKEDPSDLDLCALFEGSAFDALPPASRQALKFAHELAGTVALWVRCSPPHRLSARPSKSLVLSRCPRLLGRLVGPD